MLLPYYVASLNIEHAYYERMKQYEPFPGLCFVDTLDMAQPRQANLFTAANTERVEHEKEAAITVIIGNPPYNVGQKSENDNNRNRKYKVVDDRVRETYTKDSKATNKNSLSDMYVKFFRWAADRLKGRDGIVCFVSNNGFLHGIAFDGFRKHLSGDFQRIDHFDLRGNARTSGERRREEGGNVFDDQIRTGIGITLAVRKHGAGPRIRYYVVLPHGTSEQKRRILADLGSGSAAPWQVLTPDSEHTWLVPEHASEYREFPAIAELFDLHTSGLKTNRDDVVYDWDREKLSERIKNFIKLYNAEVYRHRAEPGADWPDQVNWSRDLKQDAQRGNLATFDGGKIHLSLYRPFSKRWLFFDRILNEEIYQWPKISGVVLAVPGPGNRKPFGVLVSGTILPLDLAFEKSQCFPLSHLKDSAVAQFRQHYSDDSIAKDAVFHYLYALLHHPGYRERYAANLKRELPRIPFASAGKELARLHVDYESLDPWPLREIETAGVPYSQRVEKMKLSADKRSLQVNPSLTLEGIPPEAFEYRLGSRSALEWVVDQYQVKGESDPNRENDSGYIVRLVGQVVRVSVATVQIIRSLPN
jgi:predicted helicase